MHRKQKEGKTSITAFIKGNNVEQAKPKIGRFYQAIKIHKDVQL